MSSTKRPSPRRKRGSSRRRTAAPKYFAPISATGSALRASGPDPVEPRREGGEEETGEGAPADDAEDGEERQRDRGRGRVEQQVHHSTSRIISISTGIPIGSSAMPTAERACLPITSPNTSTMRSEKPLITLGCSWNPSAEFTM